MSCELTFKVDVDTLQGYTDGVPRLLDILGKKGIRASFFFSMGPDNSGKVNHGIFSKCFLAKMLRIKAPVSAPMIAASNPDILKRAVSEGHDCGVRSWDHALWRDHLPELTRMEIRDELRRAAELFSDITGTPPKSCAAPGWQVSLDSLSAQNELEFDYASDARGISPFLPSVGGTVFRTLQIPTTLPALGELLGTGGITVENVNGHYLDLLEPGLNVHTIHAEVEGCDMSGIFEGLVDCCVDGEMAFPTLRDVASRFGNAAPERAALECGVKMSEVPGRIGKVAVQLR